MNNENDGDKYLDPNLNPLLPCNRPQPDPGEWRPILVMDLFIEEVRKETRRIGFKALRKLQRSQTSPKARALLKPLSADKALYKYWRRAGDERIAQAFAAAEQNILNNPPKN